MIAWATVASHSSKPRRHKIGQFLPKFELEDDVDVDADFDEYDESNGQVE